MHRMTKDTVLVYNLVDLIDAGVDLASLPSDGLQFQIAQDRFYVKPRSKCHTWLSLLGHTGRIVQVQYKIN